MNLREPRASAGRMSLGTEKLLRAGLDHHRAGRLAEAEACYRELLAGRPDHDKALHLLGLIAHQVGQHAAAVASIRQAIARNGTSARYYADLSAALKHDGQPDAAVAAAREALRLQPDLAEAHCNLGAALRDRGEANEAAAAFRETIRLRPDFAEAHANLGVLLSDCGERDAAIAAFREAVRIEPGSAQSHFNLGHALRAQGRLDEAVAACRQAIRIAPDHAGAHCGLGALLIERGALDEAVAACRRAIRIAPGYAEAHSNLGVALCAQGKLDEAVAAHRKAVRIAPANAEAHSRLGTTLAASGQLDAALAAHREAIRLKPDFAEGHANLARVLHDQNRVEDAVTAFRHAISLKPGFADAYNNLGLSLRALGRFSEGRAALEEAVRLAPSNVSYHRNLGEIAPFVAGDSRLVALERQDTDTLLPDDRVELHFALAKAYEDCGRHDAAFRHWLAGNALKRRQIAYDEPAILGALDRTREVFTPTLFRAWQHAGEPSQAPVFIVGMMRSGTTLIEQILASHPQVFGAGELRYLTGALKSLPAMAGKAFPDAVPALASADFRELGARYLAELKRLAPDAARITDKMPGNFAFAGLIHLALPNAIIIHAVRDPVDTCVSCFSKLFTAEQGHTYDLGELGRYYRRYQALMAHWHAILPPGRILDVRYEDVVADLEGEARRIVAHCGLEWDARCLVFHETERPVRTASATQVRRPIYDSAVGRWRAHRAFLHPLLVELGIASRTPDSF
jgi:tetratricopeptide (TPR) repeat protein